MSMIAIWLRSRMTFMSSRIWAWIVTSSAVVGSSAMSRAGFVERAMAIMTRWRMPPDSWWGYSLARRFGIRDADQAEHLDGLLHRLAAGHLEVERDRLGDLVAAGVDRVERGHRLLEDHRDLVPADLPHVVLGELERGPGRRAGSRPPRSCPAGSMRRMIDIAVMLLPQPDSPTTPRVLPSSTEKLTPSTALTVPSWVKKWVRRPRISSRGLRRPGRSPERPCA